MSDEVVRAAEFRKGQVLESLIQPGTDTAMLSPPVVFFWFLGIQVDRTAWAFMSEFMSVQLNQQKRCYELNVSAMDREI